MVEGPRQGVTSVFGALRCVSCPVGVSQTYASFRASEDRKQALGELQQENAALSKRVQALSEENMRLLNNSEELAFFRQEVFAVRGWQRVVVALLVDGWFTFRRRRGVQECVW
jgi:hypothetical protein